MNTITRHTRAHDLLMLVAPTLVILGNVLPVVILAAEAVTL